MHHSHRQSIEFVLICLVSSSLLQETFTNKLCVKHFCVIFISPLLYTVIMLHHGAVLHHGRFVPQDSLFRWAHVLLTYYTVQTHRCSVAEV